MQWIFLVIGIVVAAPVAAVLTALFSRRTLAIARRVRQRQRRDQHLLELARLTGGLAHEIKNPLSTVKLNLKLLAEDLGGWHPRDLHARDAGWDIKLRSSNAVVQWWM